MDERQSRRDFAKGFLEGLEAAFEEVEKMLARGHNNAELRVVVPTRKAAMVRDVQRQMREQGIDIDEKLESRPVPAVTIPRLAPGERALFIESGPSLSVETLKRLVDSGSRALAIVRTDPERFKSLVGREGVEVKWLVSDAPSSGARQAAAMLGVSVAMDISSIPSAVQDSFIKAADMSGLDATVNEFIKKGGQSVIYVEGIGYLVSVNQFPPVLKLVQRLCEKTIGAKGNLILSLAPGSVEPKEQALVGNEMAHVVAEAAPQK